MKQNVLDKSGKVVAQMKLNEELFDGKVNIALLYQVVNSYLANRRSLRIASTKTRAEVKGSGVKPWRQKGTGRARVGERRNPLWRKGGIVFGPKPRRVYKKIPKKMKLSALKSALNAKCNDKELIIVDKLEIQSSKTEQFLDLVKNLNLSDKSLFVDRDFTKDSRLSCRNLKNTALARASDLNAHLSLNCKNLVLTKEALKILEDRILKRRSSKTTTYGTK
jgi:large subunit ribosomal protein L4